MKATSAAVFVLLFVLMSGEVVDGLPNGRPKPEDRKFKSNAVEALLSKFALKFKDKDINTIFQNCMPNTLDTTVDYFGTWEGFPASFVITGDIPAMWLRDSMNQLMPYMGLMKSEPKLQQLILGAVHLQAYFIKSDPYANAFVNAPLNQTHSSGDNVTPRASKIVWESKYELDSLVSFLRLSYEYYSNSGDVSFIKTKEWADALQVVIKTIKLQQRGTLESFGSEDYTFSRDTSINTETQYANGLTAPVRRCGLVKSSFRPSDDSTIYPFFIPANAMASVGLLDISKMLNATGLWSDLSQTAKALGEEIRNAILTEAVVDHPKFGKILAYEVNGFGSYNLMDDANVPSLLSLPYMGFMARNDPLYLRTRKFVLSDWNPYRFSGSVGAGIGGPHVGLNMIWPMSWMVQALTSDDKAEISDLLNKLKTSTAGTGFMHESLNVDDPNNYTRPWFAWANGLFGQLILQLAREHPDLIFK